MAFPQIESTPVWVSYIDLANDVKPFLQIPASDTTRDVVLQDYIDAACWWAQDYLGQPITPTEFQRRFNGNSGFMGAHIMLPYHPILGVPAVTEYWGQSGGHVLPVQAPTNQVDGFACDAVRGRLTRVFPGLIQKPWFPGNANIEVTWVAGYNPVPRPWILATKRLVKHWWDCEQQASRGIAVRDQYGEVHAGQAGAAYPGVPEHIMAAFAGAVQVGLA